MNQEKNNISKNGHKDTGEGHIIADKARKNSLVRTFVAQCKNNWHENGPHYVVPLWQVEVLSLVIKGLFHNEVKNEHAPLWFNTARNVIAQGLNVDKKRENSE